MNPNLTKEIVRHILALTGSLPPPLWGQAGLSLSEFKQSKTLDLEYEDKKVIQHSLYAGEISLASDKKIISLLVDLTIDEPDIMLLCQLDSLIIHCLTLEPSDQYSFKTLTNNEWRPSTIITQAAFLSGFEVLSGSELVWCPTSQIKELLEAAISRCQ